MSKSQRGLSYVLGESHSHENHILPINAIQYCPTSRTVFSAGRDGCVKAWTADNQVDSLAAASSAAPLLLLANSSTGLFRFQNEPVDLDEQLLKLESSITSSRLTHPDQIAHNYAIAATYNVHFDWVNDIALVNQNHGLVSCSSDLSLKYIRIGDSAEGPTTADCDDGIFRFQNAHTDYVKKLSYIANDNKIISGGLDGKIVTWDLNTLTHIRKFDNTSSSSALATSNSVYSLANNCTNGLIACGGPNNTINLFDVRNSGPSPFIKKLIGHTDNIRCLLMNDHHILSGSSDTTIKLWDIRNFKVLQTFEIHDDPVWALAADASTQGLNSFYSSDKSGMIIKTDLSYLSLHRPTDLCPQISQNLDEKLGLLTIIAKPHTPTPVIALCVEEDRSIWSSTPMHLNRHYIPYTDNLSKYQYLRACTEYDINKGLNDLLLDGGAAVTTLTDQVTTEVNDLNSGFYDLVSHLSIDTNTLDLQSTLSAVAVNNANIVINDDDSIDFNDYNSMFLSINGGPSQDFVNSEKQPDATISNENANGVVADLPIEILLNPLPEEHITSVPYNNTPFNSFAITPKSVISKRFFNNKRHIFALYMNGDIKIWDIFIGKEIKNYPGTYNEEKYTLKEYLEERAKEMDEIFNGLQTLDTLSNWCDVEIKAGKLIVIIKESTFDNVKIYYDELIAEYPYLGLDHPDATEAKRNSNVKVFNDDRFFLSRIFFNSAFHKYAIYEWEFDSHVRAALKDVIPSSNKSKISKFKSDVSSDSGSMSGIEESSNDGNGGGSSGGSALKRIKMFGRKASGKGGAIPRVQSQQLLNGSSNGSIYGHSNGGSNLPPSPQISFQLSLADSNFSLGGDYTTDISEFIKFNHDTLTEIETKYPSFRYYDSIMKLIQINKQRYRERYNKNGNKKLVESLLSIYSNDPKYESKVRPNTAVDENKSTFELYKPLINVKRLPNFQFMVLEHSPELGNMRELCSFHLNDLEKLEYGKLTNGDSDLIKDLRLFLPKWIGQPILYDFFPAKDSPKIAFQLVEYDYDTISADKKIGGKSGKKIKKLPLGRDVTIKLSSHNMLRVAKILSYLTEKFESRTPEMKENKLPHEWLELECRNEVLPVNMTLQTIKTKFWKSGSDIVLTFRRKYD